MAGPISAAKRVSSTAPKKLCSGGGTVCDLTGPESNPIGATSIAMSFIIVAYCDIKFKAFSFASFRSLSVQGGRMGHCMR